MSRYQLLDRGVFDHETRSIVLPDAPEWQVYREWLTAGGVPMPNDPVGQMPLDEAKRQRIDEINSYCAGQRNKIIKGRSAGEMASWGMKLLDALAVTQGQDSPYKPLMAAIGTALGLPTTPNSINDTMGMIRGNGEADYVSKVLRDGTQFIAAECALDAVRGKHCDAIEAMTDVSSIVVYDWRQGWPIIP